MVFILSAQLSFTLNIWLPGSIMTHLWQWVQHLVLWSDIYKCLWVSSYWLFSRGCLFNGLCCHSYPSYPPTSQITVTHLKIKNPYSSLLGASRTHIPHYWVPQEPIFLITGCLKNPYSSLLGAQWSQELQKLHDNGPGGHLNINMSPYQYRDPHVKDKRVARPGNDGLYIEEGPSIVATAMAARWLASLLPPIHFWCIFCDRAVDHKHPVTWGLIKYKDVILPA